MIKKIYKYLDDPKRYVINTFILTIISISIGAILGLSRITSMLFYILIGDIWAHSHWMKIRHVYPSHQWYYNSGPWCPDYPMVSLYFHYFSGFLYEYFYPGNTPNENFSLADIVSDSKKYSIRVTILILTYIVYYPSAIWVVTKIIDKKKTAFRFILIMLLLNNPILMLTEYMMVQINTPHYVSYLFTSRKNPTHKRLFLNLNYLNVTQHTICFFLFFPLSILQ